MRSILIICDIFPPAFGPRMGYLCKYLRLNGWNPVVITEYIDDDMFSFLKGNVDVTYVRYYRKKGFAGKIEWLWTMVRDILFDYKDNVMYKKALAVTSGRQFDLVLCSAYRTFPLQAAWRFAKTSGLPFVIDLRDIIEQYTGNEFVSHSLPRILGLEKVIMSVFRKKNIRKRNHILRKAVTVTTISPWHVSFLKEFNDDVRLIYNGFDSEIFYPVDTNPDKFYITYTGRFLSTAMRDPELLFQALEKLAADNVISRDMFVMRWFIDNKSRKIIMDDIGKYSGISEFMEYSEYVPAAEIPSILNESSILLLLTNKSDAYGPKGVMTTKFFESLAVCKPILCVRGDEGCLEEVINRTRSGLSAHNADEVYDFIKDHYLRWKDGNPHINDSDIDEVKKYSREMQARQFIRIFEESLCDFIYGYDDSSVNCDIASSTETIHSDIQGDH